MEGGEKYLLHKCSSSLADMASLGNTQYVKALKGNLTAGLDSIAIMLQGDSTGNGTNEWFYTAMQKLSGKYPKYSFMYSLWNDTLQCYDTSTVMQTGSSGEAYIAMGTGALDTGNSSQNVTNDLDVRLKVALDNWSPSAECVLACKSGGGGKSWVLGVDASKKLYLWWTTDGTTITGGDFAGYQSTIGLPVNNGDDICVRATLDVDNGASGKTIKFYYSTNNGISWTQLGTDVTTAGITSIFASTSGFIVDGRGSPVWTGKFYWLEVRNGIDGEIIASPNACMAPVADIELAMMGSFYDKQGSKWTIHTGSSLRNGSPAVMLLNASTSGKALSYSSDVTRFAKQTPMPPLLAFISYSHNEGGAKDYPTAYPAFIEQIKTKYPFAGVVCCTQNPRKAPYDAQANKEHTKRCMLISQIAAIKNVGLVDVHSMFINTGHFEDFIGDDGVHPTQSGFDLWRDEVLRYLSMAMN